MRTPLYTRAIAVVVAMAFGTGIASAQATRFVSAGDQAYDDLDLLVVAGHVSAVISGDRPHSRAAFRRFVDEAHAHIGSQTVPRRVTEALARLEARFSGEDSRIRRVVATTRRMDAAFAQSPPRPMRPGADGNLAADLNPLLQRDHGRRIEDGITAALEGGVALESRWLAGAVIPRFSIGFPRSGETRPDATLTEGYLRTVVGPIGLSVGRTETDWGYGTERGNFLSDNARGLDMLRAAGDRPIRLVGPLRRLGLWNGSFAIADLGPDREFPGAKLFLARIGGRPSRFVEVAATYANMQGGKGAPPASLGDRIRDLLLLPSNPANPKGLFEFSDKVVGFDLRLSVPRIRSALQVEFLSTDARDNFQQPTKGYTEDAAWLIGAEAKALGPTGRWDALVQWRRVGARPFSHAQFTSGMTVDRRVLGDPLGPNSRGWITGLDWSGRAARLRLRATFANHLGDRFRWESVPNTPGNESTTPWRRVADNPDELRRRIILDYVRLRGWLGRETTLRIGLEHVTRFDYGDSSRGNVLAQITLRDVR